MTTATTDHPNPRRQRRRSQGPYWPDSSPPSSSSGCSFSSLPLPSNSSHPSSSSSSSNNVPTIRTTSSSRGCTPSSSLRHPHLPPSLLLLFLLLIPPMYCSNSSSSSLNLSSNSSVNPETTNAPNSTSSDLTTTSSSSSSSPPPLTTTLYEILKTNIDKNQTSGAHFELFTLNWQHIATPFGVSLWLLLASFAKIFFNMNKHFAEAVPDSALLIVLGLALGGVLRLLDVDGEVFTLRARTFFLYLLPPIIFDAGYFMPNRQLFENFDSVLLFAFVGTIWNTLAIGFSLFWLGHLGLFSVPFSAFQILLFASLISAVDPVAVIAVFEEIHINEFLFINVFGEALFNDGVSVVLYQMFRKFIAIGEPNLAVLDYVAGVGSFVVIALGGVLIGLLFSIIACTATKFTTRVRILAPVFIFVVPYMSYLTAEMFGLSSILAIVACGISMKQYVKGNLSHDAAQSVKYFVKMLAQCSETMIFMFLGLSTVSKPHHWDWAFIGATIGFCLLFRVIGVVVQCFMLNRFRTKKFSATDQFVLSYGGLRGAIAFGLVVSLDDTLLPKQMFVTTCILVIFFTVFVQGITIRPLLYWLKVEKHDVEREETMIEKICSRHCDYMMAGLEDVAGLKGRNAVRDTFERFNAKVLKPALMRDERREQFDGSAILRAYTKLTLLEAQRLVRVSARRRAPVSCRIRGAENGGHRVAPAPSPSSATSTLTYCHWTMENGGGGKAEDERKKEKPEEGSQLEDGEEEHGLPNIPAADPLYAKVSRLLELKMEEGMRRRRDQGEGGEEDDIKDNYIQSLIGGERGGGGGSRWSAGANRQMLVGPRGGGRRRLSLSPAMERQMGAPPIPPPAAVCQLSASQLRQMAEARRLFQQQKPEEGGGRRRGGGGRRE